jgi:hypothetical protein
MVLDKQKKKVVYCLIYLFYFDCFLKDELWLHVRGAGNWTNKLYEYYTDYPNRVVEYIESRTLFLNDIEKESIQTFYYYEKIVK